MSSERCTGEHAYLRGLIRRGRWKCTQCGDVFPGYCRPWWCLSRRSYRFHPPFHITYQKMCRSRRDQRAIRSIAADLHAMRDAGLRANAATTELRATLRYLAGNPDKDGEK